MRGKIEIDINSYEGYGLVTALRGPDWTSGECLKSVTTAVLRQVVGLQQWIYGPMVHKPDDEEWVRGHFSEREVKSVTSEVLENYRAAFHFFAHLRYGTAWWNSCPDSALNELYNGLDKREHDALHALFWYAGSTVSVICPLLESASVSTDSACAKIERATQSYFEKMRSIVADDNSKT